MIDAFNTLAPICLTMELFEPIFALLVSAERRHPAIFELLHYVFVRHVIDLSILLYVLVLPRLPQPLCCMVRLCLCLPLFLSA